jgi:hypothetical protein
LVIKKKEMKNKFSGLIITSIVLLGVLTVASCKKDKEVAGTDKELYAMVFLSSGIYWYKNSSSLLDKSSGSGHPQPFLRTWYNTAAATQLDTNGKIMPGAAFPEGSLVVKELYENSSTRARYAILFKDTDHPDADARGWVWGYINDDGSVAEPASKKGSSCIGCHSQDGNIDYMLMNKYFP